MEDRSRRNNVWLVGLPEGAEGSNAAGFLRVNLSKWIPSLRHRNIEIDWAHRVYDGRKNTDRLRTLIFRVLRWHDRSEILRGARQAYPVKWPFLTYPVAIKLWHKGEQKSFDSPQKAEDFISSLSQRKTYAEDLQGNGNTAAIISSTRREGLEGRDGGDPNCPGDDGGRVEMDTC